MYMGGGGGGEWNAHLLKNHGGGGQDEKIGGLHEKSHWGEGGSEIVSVPYFICGLSILDVIFANLVPLWRQLHGQHEA